MVLEGTGVSVGPSPEDPGVFAGSSQAPEVLAASRAIQEVLQISDEEPQPPPLGSHNSELFPELDSQTIPQDMREKVSAIIEAGAVEKEREKWREREREKSFLKEVDG